MPKYKVNEIFYSLKGEGWWTGTPMKFVRLSGCNLKCPFCDTPDRTMGELDEQEIIKRLKLFPKECKYVVITGGEPMIQPVEFLRDALIEEGYHVHLETNGIYPIYGPWHWVAVSPKSNSINPGTIARAMEIKFLVGEPGWESLINDILPLIGPYTKKLVMPVARGYKEKDFTKGEEDIDLRNTKIAIEYCKQHPDFSFCVQLHKYLNIP